MSLNKHRNEMIKMSAKMISIPNTEEVFLESQIVGDTFKLFIRKPVDYDKDNKEYPVIFLLDGNVYFSFVAGAVKLLEIGKEMPESLIVGVGYPSDSKHLYLRNRDLLPTYNKEHRNSGGAEAFYDFLTSELLPYIDDHYRIDMSKSVLAGDSYSGLFAFYALLRNPELFSGYIIGSPSLYWDNGVIFDLEKKFSESNDDFNARVFLSVGELEARYEPEYAGMVSNVERLISVLKKRNYNGLNLYTHIFPNETHMSVIPAAISWGLRFVYQNFEVRE